MIRSLLALLLALFLALPAFAQDRAPPHDGVQAEELERLVRTLETESDRKVLVEQLKGLVTVQRKGDAQAEAGVLGAISDQLEVLGNEVMDAVGALKDLPKLVNWASAQAVDAEARQRWVETLTTLAVLMAAGMLADHLLSRLLRRPERLLLPKRPAGLLLRLPYGLARALLGLLPVAMFAAAAWGVLGLWELKGNMRVAALMLGAAYVSVRLVMVLARLLAAPRAAGLRLLPLDDESAEYVVIWVRRLAGIGVFGYFALEAARLLGLPKGGHLFLMKALGLSITAMLVIFILQNRQAVAGWLRGSSRASALGRRVQGVQSRLAEIWHILAVLYVVAGYAVWALRVKGGFDFMVRASLLSLGILAVSALVSTGLARLIERGFAVSQESRERFPLLEGRANRYLPVLHLVLRGTVALVTVAALAQAWGLDTLGLVASDAGRRVVASAISIAAVLVVALMVWELISGAIERYLAATDGEGRSVERSSRARTLLPLARNALMIVLMVMVSLIVLAELGVNIAPLLAGAGVVGIAIGFGSQKLVQDVITGAFILFEDTIAVGDVVKLDAHSGSVEAISIRAIRLRDGQGAVHTVPFSTVGTVVNMSRQFAYAVFEIGISYGEDPDRVMEVLKELGAEMQDDAEFGPLLLDDLEVWGLERFDASAIILKARFKTMPLKQWGVSREFNRRMKKRFDELGIEMPFPQSTVWLGEDRKGKVAQPKLTALAG